MVWYGIPSNHIKTGQRSIKQFRVNACPGSGTLSSLTVERAKSPDRQIARSKQWRKWEEVSVVVAKLRVRSSKFKSPVILPNLIQVISFVIG
eukprot:scaffold2205_cov183-Ochromonas_danica.AAC.27